MCADSLAAALRAKVIEHGLDAGEYMSNAEHDAALDELAADLVGVVLAWLRGDALISQSQVAQLAGVTRAAVSNWAKRDPNFPAVVVDIDGVGVGGAQLRLRAEVEVEAYLSGHRPSVMGETIAWLTPEVRTLILAEVERTDAKRAAARFGLTVRAVHAVVKDSRHDQA
jgi:hypothetical protein